MKKWNFPSIRGGKKMGVGKETFGTKMVGKMGEWGKKNALGRQLKK